jgi:hypothetical protein
VKSFKITAYATMNDYQTKERVRDAAVKGLRGSVSSDISYLSVDVELLEEGSS